MAQTTTSVHMNLHHPNGGNTMTLEELVTLKEQGMRAAATRALEDGYVVTIKLNNKDFNYDNEFSFHGEDQVMTMGEFFDIIERLEDEPSK
jgi:hypothetical protein